MIKQCIRAAKRALRPAHRHGKTSYSQCGEDLLVEYVFGLRGVRQPTYIDIGAHHPFFLSNTAFFYQKGCRGINIEANPGLIKGFEIHRPQDVNLNIGVGETEGDLDFFIMEDSTLSTFSGDEMRSLQGHGHRLISTEQINIRTLQQVINEHHNGIFPDFLSLDVEGKDLEILRTIDYAGSVPKIICVEAAEYSPSGSGSRKTEIIDFLVGKGYFEYASTNLNAIMVNRAFWLPPAPPAVVSA